MRKDEVKYEIIVKKVEGFNNDSELQHIKTMLSVAEREVVDMKILERKPRETTIKPVEVVEND